VERINLDELAHTVERVWVCGEPGHWRYSEIRLGRLDERRWFAARSGNRWDGAWAAWVFRRGGTWQEISPTS
jgi:hypothetical protein